MVDAGAHGASCGCVPLPCSHPKLVASADSRAGPPPRAPLQPAYSRRLLQDIPYHLNSDDFVFDQELVAQVVAAGGLRIGEIAVPTRYFEEASSVNFRRSVVYGLSTLRVVARFLLHRARIRRSPKLTARRPAP